MAEDARINWYRTPVDKDVLKSLTARSDRRGFCQMIPQLLFSTATGALAYMVWLRGPSWAVVLACYLHATFYWFLGLAGCGHELCHRTVFRTHFWNEFFVRLVSFLSWTNFHVFRASHARHHAVTVHHGLDLEVILPQKIRLRDWIYSFTFDVPRLWAVLRGTFEQSLGMIRGEWNQRILPKSDVKARRAVIRWARILLTGHGVLAAGFLLSGQWILIFIVTLAPFYAGWLNNLVAWTQHLCLQPDVDDYRLCARTIRVNPVLEFFYSRMNYHLEHHMYAAVPFYHLPKLRAAVEYDLPRARRGLWAVWKELLPALRRQKADPSFVLVPELPGPASN